MMGSTEAAAVPLGCRTYTGFTTASKLLPAREANGLDIPPNVDLTILTIEDQSMRYKDDGTNPTTTKGVMLLVGRRMKYTSDPRNLSFIELAATATIQAAFYKLS